FVVGGFAPNTYSVDAILSNGFGCEVPLVLNFTVDVCVGTEDVALAESIELFPNPTSGRATVRLRNLRASDYSLQVFDAAGRMVRQRRILPLQGEYQAEVDLTDMPGGAYLVRLVSGDGLLVRRLVVE
ncbi:MAG: T9SS type A sorting domain-containing protein, partial [Phaeodactylibacter sp.]|nr:T9SS type A sorting domain-containing protein [Phaeodactylibacter sp.]